MLPFVIIIIVCILQSYVLLFGCTPATDQLLRLLKISLHFVPHVTKIVYCFPLLPLHLTLQCLDLCSNLFTSLVFHVFVCTSMSARAKST